jgi:chromosome segregation and condensation protein ScpB
MLAPIDEFLLATNNQQLTTDFMSLKAQLEAIIYAAETPITTEQVVQLVKESVIAGGAADEAEVKSRVRASLEELVADYSTGCRCRRWKLWL